MPAQPLILVLGHFPRPFSSEGRWRNFLSEIPPAESLSFDGERKVFAPAEAVNFTCACQHSQLYLDPGAWPGMIGHMQKIFLRLGHYFGKISPMTSALILKE